MNGPLLEKLLYAPALAIPPCMQGTRIKCCKFVHPNDTCMQVLTQFDSLMMRIQTMRKTTCTYFQGARWDINIGSIADSRLKELHPSICWLQLTCEVLSWVR